MARRSSQWEKARLPWTEAATIMGLPGSKRLQPQPAGVCRAGL
ncbi:hypothetical protein [Enterocloster lavalensis]|nr:hypothetical protein [Enterocloster lavalensis]